MITLTIMNSAKEPFKPIYEAPPMSMKACRHGVMLYNVNDLFVGRSFDLYGEFSENELSFLGQFIKPGQVVYDVGANIGAHTIFFARSVGPKGQVVSFEPQRPVFQVMCANVALNALTNVATYQAGVGEMAGETTLQLPNYNGVGNFGGVSLIGQQGDEVVQVMTLDGCNLAPPSLIKIDVEGMELAVLKGAQQTISKHMPVLYVENDRKEKSPEVIAHVLALGYRAYWHIPALFSAENFAGNPENVFANTVSLNLICVPAQGGQTIEGLKEVQSVDEFPL